MSVLMVGLARARASSDCSSPRTAAKPCTPGSPAWCSAKRAAAELELAPPRDEANSTSPAWQQSKIHNCCVALMSCAKSYMSTVASAQRPPDGAHSPTSTYLYAGAP